MQGIDEDKGPAYRYRPIEEMSDSDEAEMSVSDNESGDEAKPPAKKQARTETKAADGDSVPRWSNPDPYTALPPPDDSQKKKKDVVKLIRKARVTGTENTTKPDATIGDFISFDFDDDDSADGQYTAVDDRGNGVPGAPTGPRSKGKTTAPPAPEPPRDVRMLRNEQVLRDTAQQRDEVSTLPQETSRETGPIQIKLPAKLPVTLPSKPVPAIDFASDPSLGNRKRTIRDELKGPPQIWGSLKGKKGPSDGRIISSWRIPANSSGTPWVEVDHSNSANMGIW